MKEEPPLGEHYLIELWDCEFSKLDNLPAIQKTMSQAALVAGGTIVDEKFHKFAPQGVSGVVVIAESHLSIHTWPELGYAAMDLFTCKLDMDIKSCIQLIQKHLCPGNIEIKRILRGMPKKRPMQLSGLNMVSA